MRQRIFKLAELFCGPGGLALGAVNARVVHCDTVYSIKPVWANDIHKDTCMTYARNIHKGGEGRVICDPVETVDLKAMPRFDALAFGFPCNDFSIVGEHKGLKGKYGALYTYAISAINIHNPQWFIAENVVGIRSANNGKTFDKILKDLKNAGQGYRITTHLYKFEEYGVPQTRHRIIIVGIRSDLGLAFNSPLPTTANNPMAARVALEQPPISVNAINHEIAKLSGVVAERLSYIPPGENAWYEGIPEHLQLNVKKARMSLIYRRLHPDKPSYTITGSGGGGTHAYHWRENRALTNRERARLQTFPDDFIFEGNKESVRRQIGMAVPPKAASIILSAVLKAFADAEYDLVSPKVTNIAYQNYRRDDFRFVL